MYEQLFERNYGIFSPEEQQRIRAAKVVIIGCGVVGAAIAYQLSQVKGLNITVFDQTNQHKLQQVLLSVF